MRLIRYFGYGLLGLLVLVGVSLAAVALIVDGSFVKSRLERHLKENNQRNITIEGEPKVRVFPVAGIELGKTVLYERNSDKVFVSLSALQVGVRMLPLLSGEIAVDSLVLSGLRANILKTKDGKFNFDDLAESKGGATPKDEVRKESGGSEPPRIRIGEIRIESAQVGYRDERSGQELTIANVNVKTGRLESDTPSPFSMSMEIAGKRPDVNFKASVGGAARINPARQSFAFSKLDFKASGNAADMRSMNLSVTGDIVVDRGRNLIDVNGLQIQATGTVGRDALNLVASAPRIDVSPSKAAGSAVVANLKIAGPQRSVAAVLNLGAVSGSATALSIPDASLKLDATDEGNTVKAQINTPVLANLAAKTWDLPKIVANVTLGGPMIPQKSVTLPIQASFKTNLDRQTLAAEIATKFDESSIRATLAATKMEPLNASFDLNVDKLNLDRYIRSGTDKPGAADPPVDLSALKGKNVIGKIQIGALQAQRVKLSEIKAEIRLANGKLDVAPHSANLYGGQLQGSLSADANVNQVSVKESARGVAINPLLVDFAEKDILEGKGDISIDVTMSGQTVGAMKRALNGSARIQMTDGAYKGINLGETFRKASSLGSRSGSQSGDKTQKTDFSEMSASFAIAKGVARNDDLSMKSPFVRVGGSGDIDIGNSRLDYTARASLVATATGQQGRDDAAGVTIPVRLHGGFDAVKYDIQYGAVFSGLGNSLGNLFGGGKSRDAAPAKGGSQPAQSATDAVKDRLKGLFGR